MYNLFCQGLCRRQWPGHNAPDGLGELIQPMIRLITILMMRCDRTTGMPLVARFWKSSFSPPRKRLSALVFATWDITMSSWMTAGPMVGPQMALYRPTPPSFRASIIHDSWSILTCYSNGMAHMADSLHSMGLGFGMYSDAGSMTCGQYGKSSRSFVQ